MEELLNTLPTHLESLILDQAKELWISFMQEVITTSVVKRNRAYVPRRDEIPIIHPMNDHTYTYGCGCHNGCDEAEMQAIRSGVRSDYNSEATAILRMFGFNRPYNPQLFREYPLIVYELRMKHLPPGKLVVKAVRKRRRMNSSLNQRNTWTRYE